MAVYDVAVIGGGAAGSMAAIRAASNGKAVILLERNDSIGKKILITGKGRCNITNMATMEDFLAKFGKKGMFLRSAFNRFFNEDLIEFFKKKGLALKTERQNRVFPDEGDAKSVVRVLREYLSEAGVEVRYNTRITGINYKEGFFRITSEGGVDVQSRKLILCTGGASYKATGSSGDGFRLAKAMGHHVSPLMPGLVPLKAKDTWVKELQGLTLKNIRLSFRSGKRCIISEIGEMLFTHFGVSGPIVLDLSSEIAEMIEDEKEVVMNIDLKPGIEDKELEDRILSDIISYGGKDIKNFLKTYMPIALCPVFMRLAELPENKRVSQMTTAERRSMKENLKALPLTLSGTLALEEAMVTAGGVSLKEVDPRTMQSRIVPGLYFAGEILEGAASSGGYNLQQAFSTGYLAGEESSQDA
ncbi:MAG: NAD(P)/FAD-dependent oxidoreductase [Candidatus Omnitrophica bacterium]|nr:NAD(P)/FAD-dependent oxidoreductase [Candidatus Omnitrophota bacterium]